MSSVVQMPSEPGAIAITPIHPFPARMAPEIVLQETACLAPDSLLMDPMMGSGTVVRVAAENGHRAMGFDMDPLAVLMTKVWTTPIDTDKLQSVAEEVASEAMDLRASDISLAWMDNDDATLDFVDYWFGEDQKNDLRKLSSILNRMRGTIRDALRIALSRIIITKKRGASLAWDVSHSRPHRVMDENDFCVIEEFLRSVGVLNKRLSKQPPPGNVQVRKADARDLHDVTACSVDAVVTSPPYLNAIDYLRGHKLALVWFGYNLAEIRSIRTESIGNGLHRDVNEEEALVKAITECISSFDSLPASERRMFEKYVVDLSYMMSEIYRVLRRQGKAILVVGNSRLRGVDIDNASAVSTIAERRGFQLVGKTERTLPPNRRYLPPPSDLDNSDLKKRMRTEVVLRYKKP